jgi:DNA polymerase/3'-5' exonuclease PolX
MELERARQIARNVIYYFGAACEQIAIAGSIRRLKAEVKDIEIVYVPLYEEQEVNLFEVAQVPATEGRVTHLIRGGYWELDSHIKRNGPKYKRLVKDGVAIELFRAERDNWGLIYALRTGSADFMRAVVTRSDAEWAIGCMPTDMFMRDGDLWRMTPQGRQVIPTPTEESFFAAIGLPVFPPEERDIGRLCKWLRVRSSPWA